MNSIEGQRLPKQEEVDVVEAVVNKVTLEGTQSYLVVERILQAVSFYTTLPL